MGSVAGRRRPVDHRNLLRIPGGRQAIEPTDVARRGPQFQPIGNASAEHLSAAFAPSATTGAGQPEG